MGLIDKIPGIGSKVQGMKSGVSALMLKSVDTQYAKAGKNFLVLGYGLQSGCPIPKLVKKCKGFYKDNWKESGWPDETCKRLDEVFERIEEEEFLVEDGDWFVGEFQQFLKDRCSGLKLAFMKRVLR